LVHETPAPARFVSSICRCFRSGTRIRKPAAAISAATHPARSAANNAATDHPGAGNTVDYSGTIHQPNAINYADAIHQRAAALRNGSAIYAITGDAKSTVGPTGFIIGFHYFHYSHFFGDARFGDSFSIHSGRAAELRAASEAW
jgi:hypothetical protein